jgi:hypothetical protein
MAIKGAMDHQPVHAHAVADKQACVGGSNKQGEAPQVNNGTAKRAVARSMLPFHAAFAGSSTGAPDRAQAPRTSSRRTGFIIATSSSRSTYRAASNVRNGSWIQVIDATLYLR